MTDTMLAAAEGRASRRLRTIKRLEAELADIEALLPAGVSIEQLVVAGDRVAELTAAVADLAEFALRIVSLERTPDIDRVIEATPDRVLRLIDADMVAAERAVLAPYDVKFVPR